MAVFALIAVRNLIQRRVRSLLLAGAIVFVSFLFSLLLALVNGTQETMVRNGTALMTGHVNVGGFYKISQSSANPLITKYPAVLEIVHQVVPEAKIIVDRVKAFGKIISETDSAQIPFWGVKMEQEASVLGQLELAKDDKGQPRGSLDQLKNRGGVALFEVHAKKLKVGVGDSVTVSVPTYRNMNNTKDLKVVAILKDVGMMSQFNAYTNAEDVRELYQNRPDSTGQIMIYLPAIQQVPVVEERLRKELSQRGYTLMEKESNPFWMKFDRVAGESWTGQRLDISTWEDETSFLKWIVNLLGALTWALTLVLSVIIVIGLMNALWMSVKERTTEVGTLRAIGMQQRQVLVMFLLESLILSTISTLLGLILAWVTAVGLNAIEVPLTNEAFKMFLMTNHLVFKFDSSLALTSFFALVCVFTLGALLPASRGAKLSPILAINSN